MPATFGVGYQVVEYPHIQRRHKIIPAAARFKVIDVAIPAGLTVGYIMGVGDQVPAALQQLGARVTLIDSDEMAWGDLSRYNAIVTGVRAYEQRADLRGEQSSAAEVRRGRRNRYRSVQPDGVQSGAVRALSGANQHRAHTDENAPVKILVPGHPVFSVPNKLNDRDWQGWVQERGTYFLAEPLDPKYVDLIEMEDPFEFNKGPKRGALVEARYGKGRWLYVGLGPVAAVAVGHGRRLPALREPDQPREGPVRTRPLAVER